MNVANRKCVFRLGLRSLRVNRTRNLAAALAIALTAMLFISLFTIAFSINEGFQQSTFRQVGSSSHGGFKYLTEEQYNELKDDPRIARSGLRRFISPPCIARMTTAKPAWTAIGPGRETRSHYGMWSGLSITIPPLARSSPRARTSAMSTGGAAPRSTGT